MAQPDNTIGEKMFHSLNIPLAQQIDVKTALVAQRLWDELNEGEWAETTYFHGERWIHASYPMLTIAMPYLSKKMVARAIRKLLSQGLIKRANLNTNRFDHSGWYSFTPKGELLMHQAESDYCPFESGQR